MTTIDATAPGWTGNEIRDALEEANIRCGEGMIVDGTLLLPVGDPDRTEEVLDRLRGVSPNRQVTWVISWY